MNTLNEVTDYLREDLARLEADQRADAATRAALHSQLEAGWAQLRAQAALALPLLHAPLKAPNPAPYVDPYPTPSERPPSTPLQEAGGETALAVGLILSESRRTTAVSVAPRAANPAPPPRLEPVPYTDPYPTQIATSPISVPRTRTAPEGDFPAPAELFRWSLAEAYGETADATY